MRKIREAVCRCFRAGKISGRQRSRAKPEAPGSPQRNRCQASRECQRPSRDLPTIWSCSQLFADRQPDFLQHVKDQREFVICDKARRSDARRTPQRRPAPRGQDRDRHLRAEEMEFLGDLAVGLCFVAARAFRMRPCRWRLAPMPVLSESAKCWRNDGSSPIAHALRSQRSSCEWAAFTEDAGWVCGEK